MYLYEYIYTLKKKNNVANDDVVRGFKYVIYVQP